MSTPSGGNRPQIVASFGPPCRLVIAHFIAGAGCATAGALLLALGFGDPANPLHPHTLAVVHLWAAGWLSLTAIGVLVQFLPVTSVCALLSPRLAWVHLGLHTSGVALLAAAMLTDLRAPLAPVGGALLGTGFLLATINLGATLLRRRGWDVWRAGIALALAHAIVTPAIGWLILVSLGQEFIGQHHLAVLAAHAHLGLGGWLFGLVVAIGGRILPMFVGAPEPNRRFVALTLGLVQAGLAALVVAVWMPGLALLGPGLLATAVGGWCGALIATFRRRKIRTPEVSIITAWAGLASLSFVAGAGVWAGWRPGVEGWALYGVLALGAAGLMVNGLLYRIVPFLIRLAAFKRSATATRVPPLANVLRPIPYRAQMVCFATGIVMLAIGTQGVAAEFTSTGRWILAAGSCGLLFNLLVLASGRTTTLPQ